MNVFEHYRFFVSVRRRSLSLHAALKFLTCLRAAFAA